MKFLYCFLIALVSLTIWSCTKSSVTGSQAPTRIRLINAMPGKSFDLILNDETLAENIAYDEQTDYLNGPAGFYKLLIHEHDNKDTVINGNQYLQAGQKYTLFMIPDSSDRTKKVRLTVITDDDLAPMFDSAKFRFFNFAPDTTSVSIVRLKRRGITDRYDTVKPYLGVGRTYLDNSLNNRVGQYMTIFTDTYLFEFLKTNDPGVIIDSLSVQIERSKFYTFFYEGYDSVKTGPLKRKIKYLVSEQ